jgi:Arc/MetJ-type ribon-helix-helix transcriptional regulator
MTRTAKMAPRRVFTKREEARIGAHIRARGLRFEVFLPEGLADWLRARIEAGVYADVKEAAFLAFQDQQALSEHPKARRALLKEMLERRMAKTAGKGISINTFRRRHAAQLEKWASTPAPRERALPKASATARRRPKR